MCFVNTLLPNRGCWAFGTAAEVVRGKKRKNIMAEHR